MENEAFEKFLQTGTIENFLKYKEVQRNNNSYDFNNFKDEQKVGCEEKL